MDNAIAVFLERGITAEVTGEAEPAVLLAKKKKKNPTAVGRNAMLSLPAPPYGAVILLASDLTVFFRLPLSLKYPYLVAVQFTQDCIHITMAEEQVLATMPDLPQPMTSKSIIDEIICLVYRYYHILGLPPSVLYTATITQNDTTMGNNSQIDNAFEAFLASKTQPQGKRPALTTTETNEPPKKKSTKCGRPTSRLTGPKGPKGPAIIYGYCESLSCMMVEAIIHHDFEDHWRYGQYRHKTRIQVESLMTVPLNNLKTDVADIKGAQSVSDAMAKNAQRSAQTADNKIKGLKQQLQQLQQRDEKANKRIDELSHVVEFLFKRVKTLEEGLSPTGNTIDEYTTNNKDKTD
ncbi:uncharacterized protein B0J16DRAFT_395512 [Fusarium flagelliforme]|uniref:uncharacterized protein n=1 Tax=Fusarium flagelliforme TaxID=2675880 RepID=UPI001E8E2555|nr:uncharacterized protein B0J16DRAFT_395512 [Fusarium flagelliforme]KAH7193622.1 hypothetical protein B0J16DRAFT_395512 [Fusarium flagelliforme]